MKIYATLDDNGRYNGFYQDDIHKVIPEGAVRITAKQRADFLYEQSNQVYTPTAADIALQELHGTENTADLARKIEDITALLLDGTALPVNPITKKAYAKDWLDKRKSLREKTKNDKDTV